MFGIVEKRLPNGARRSLFQLKQNVILSPALPAGRAGRRIFIIELDCEARLQAKEDCNVSLQKQLK
jgi:hypothetical protein